MHTIVGELCIVTNTRSSCCSLLLPLRPRMLGARDVDRAHFGRRRGRPLGGARERGGGGRGAADQSEHHAPVPRARVPRAGRVVPALAF